MALSPRETSALLRDLAIYVEGGFIENQQGLVVAESFPGGVTKETLQEFLLKELENAASATVYTERLT